MAGIDELLNLIETTYKGVNVETGAAHGLDGISTAFENVLKTPKVMVDLEQVAMWSQELQRGRSNVGVNLITHTEYAGLLTRVSGFIKKTEGYSVIPGVTEALGSNKITDALSLLKQHATNGAPDATPLIKAKIGTLETAFARVQGFTDKKLVTVKQEWFKNIKGMFPAIGAAAIVAIAGIWAATRKPSQQVDA